MLVFGFYIRHPNMTRILNHKELVGTLEYIGEHVVIIFNYI